MKTRGESLLSLFLLVLLLPLGAAAQEQQQPPPADQGRRLVVTLDGKLEDMPTLTPDEFVIEMAKQKVAPKRVYKIEELPTLIAVVLQENLSLDFGAQLPALRDFILAQPPNTYVGVFYMAAQGVENPTNGFSSDLKKVADTLRTPKGKAELAPASPYESMAKVVKWMANLPAARKEVLFFSEGSDSVAGDAAPGQNRNLRVAIGETHAAGVPVWVIYTKGLRAPIRVAENMASVRAGGSGSRRQRLRRFVVPAAGGLRRRQPERAGGQVGREGAGLQGLAGHPALPGAVPHAAEPPVRPGVRRGAADQASADEPQAERRQTAGPGKVAPSFLCRTVNAATAARQSPTSFSCARTAGKT